MSCINRFCSAEPSRGGRSVQELPYDTEDAITTWINKVQTHSWDLDIIDYDISVGVTECMSHPELFIIPTVKKTSAGGGTFSYSFSPQENLNKPTL